MENTRPGDLDGYQSLDLAKDEVLPLYVQTLQIHCVQGTLWVTWPDGNERVLKKNQTMQVRSKGIICLQALSECTLIVKSQKKRTILSIFRHRRRYAGNDDTVFGSRALSKGWVAAPQ